VSCTSDSACTAVGSVFDRRRHQLTLAARWDGKRWSQQQTPSPANGGSVLAGVSCTLGTGCMAVGSCYCSLVHESVAERWNGRGWSTQRIRHSAGTVLNAVSCTSLSACTAVGATGEGEALAPGVLVERWNGRSWSLQTAPIPDWAAGAVLNGVSCVSLTFCAAVGISISGPFDQFTGPLVEQWDGTRWAIQRAPRPAHSRLTELSSVSCTSSIACTGVGDADGSTLVELRSAGRWSIQRSANDESAGQNTLAGVSCASPTVCTAVGTTNLDAAGSAAPPSGTLAERWDGRRWFLQRTMTPAGGETLNAVACPSTNSCVAVGTGVGGVALVLRHS
jgi:hypothetical protein